MKNVGSLIVFTLFCFLISNLTSASTGEVVTRKDSVNISGSPKVYIDGGYDLNHVRREVDFVNYVRDRFLADIFILVTTMRTGSGGREYTLTFTGLNDYVGINDTLVFTSKSFDTEDQIRTGYVNILKMGLVQFIKESPVASGLQISFDTGAGIKSVKDSWDFWVFKIRMAGSFSGEQFKKAHYLSADFNVDRVTEEWKIRFEGDIDYDEENYTLPDEDPFDTHSKRWSLENDLMKSLSDHWSLGLFSSVFSSTYRNYQTVVKIGPAIEYNIFPYAESTYREIRISYGFGYQYNNYFEETIYDKLEEALLYHTLRVNVQIKQPWGSIFIYSNYSSYLHDNSKNRLRIGGWLEFNIVKGLSFDIGGRYAMIHDQLSLKKEDLDLEDILLRQSELATEYEYRLSFGISYTFGAIYNNVVNPRFGD